MDRLLVRNERGLERALSSARELIADRYERDPDYLWIDPKIRI